METKVSDFIAPNSNRAIEQAKLLNLDVVFPKKNELQIDVDDDAAYEVFKAHYDIVDRYWGIDAANIRPSRSGQDGKKHITVRLSQDVKNTERIALQAFLGSDRKRELLSYIQAENGDANPTLFLENKRRKLVQTPDGGIVFAPDEETGELVTDDPEHAQHVATFQV
jgi:hypothetical protein